MSPLVDAGMLLREPARPDAVDGHRRAVRGLGRLVDALDIRPRAPSRRWILQPSPLQRWAPRVRPPARPLTWPANLLFGRGCIRLAALNSTPPSPSRAAWTSGSCRSTIAPRKLRWKASVLDVRASVGPDGRRPWKPGRPGPRDRACGRRCRRRV